MTVIAVVVDEDWIKTVTRMPTPRATSGWLAKENSDSAASWFSARNPRLMMLTAQISK